MARLIVTRDGLWFRKVLAALGPEATLEMDIRVFKSQVRIATRLIRERFGSDGRSRADKALVVEQMSRIYGTTSRSSTKGTFLPLGAPSRARAMASSAR